MRNKATLSLSVIYEGNDADPAVLHHLLQSLVEHAADSGLLTGGLDLIVEESDFEITIDAVPRLTPRDPSPNDLIPCPIARATAQAWANSLILPPLPAGPSLEDAELWTIIRAIKECGGNLRAVARTLQIGKTTIYRKLHIYGLRAREGTD